MNTIYLGAEFFLTLVDGPFTFLFIIFPVLFLCLEKVMIPEVADIPCSHSMLC